MQGADFDGDGRARHPVAQRATGENAMWLMNGTTVSVNSLSAGWTSTWSVAGSATSMKTASPTSCGANGTTGRTRSAHDGATLSSGTVFATIADANWSVAGVGDFDGDGKSDILWQQRDRENMIYLMNARDFEQHCPQHRAGKSGRSRFADGAA